MASNGDVVILASATAAAPKNYEVPGSQHFVPLVVEALFDGSGAAGSYLPAVVLLGPSGDVIGRGLAPEVAAGSSAEVTFRPFLSRAQTDGTAVAFASYTGLSTIPNNTRTHFDLAWDGTAGQDDLFTISGGFDPIAKETGLYTIAYSVFVFTHNPPAGTLGLSMDLNNSVGGGSTVNAVFPIPTNPPFDSGPCGEIIVQWPLQAGDTWDHGIYQDTGGNLSIGANIYATRLPLTV